MTNFQLTYATMFNPLEELHNRFDIALTDRKSHLGETYGMINDRKDILTDQTYPIKNPANQDEILGYFQSGTQDQADLAVQAESNAVTRCSATLFSS
jgi:1-pyrroline-5-carboxylate dehydrogenase